MCPENGQRLRRNRIYTFGPRAARPSSRLYAQVAEELILDAMGREGDASVLLAQERELASRFEVSRSTIRNALALLEKYDLVQRRRGHGTVLTRPADEVLHVWRQHHKRLLVLQFSPVRVHAQDYFDQILSSLLSAAKVQRHTIEIRHCLSPGEVRRELQELSNREQVAAVLLCGPVDTRFVEACRTNNIPCVCIDYWPQDDHADAVTVDVEAEAFLAARHVSQLGLRSVGFATFGRRSMPGSPEPVWDPDVWRFLVHLRRAARQYKLQMCEEWLVVVPGPEALVCGAGGRLPAIDHMPEAMVCFSSAVARQMIDMLGRSGVRCPQDISIISRGDKPGAGKMQLTTLQGNTEEMGRTALRLALERVHRVRSCALRVAVASVLVPGDSTRARRSGPASLTRTNSGTL